MCEGMGSHGGTFSSGYISAQNPCRGRKRRSGQRRGRKRKGLVAFGGRQGIVVVVVILGFRVSVEESIHGKERDDGSISMADRRTRNSKP